MERQSVGVQEQQWPRGAFSVAEARAAGVTPGVLRGPRLARPTYGIRTAVPSSTLGDRCAALLHRLGPGTVVCGPTAALLWGAPLPPEWEHRSDLDIAVEAPRRAPHAAGTAGRKLTFRPGDVVQGRRGALTSPARTWCDLGALLDLGDLVAVGDFLLRERLVTREGLTAAVASSPGRRGVGLLRLALDLLDARAESRPESIVRVALVRAGVRGVEANVEIRSADGAFLGRVDLCIAWARVVIEYHGDYHRVERGRWRRDRARMGRLRAAGWHVIELTGDDLADLSSVVAQVKQALQP
jgi:hypothetical protein